MCEQQQVSPENETARLKSDLLTLIQKNIPGVLAPEEISVFMQTGVIPPVWWGEIFNQDVSLEQIEEMRLLLEFIHDDFSDGLSEEADNLSSPDALPAKIERKIVPKSVPIVKPPKKVPAKQPPGNPRKSTERSPCKTGLTKNDRPPKKKLTEKELASGLFSNLIRAALSEKTLDLTKLRLLVGQNLAGHTISHNPQDEILTLYDDMNNPAATSSARGFDIIST